MRRTATVAWQRVLLPGLVLWVALGCSADAPPVVSGPVTENDAATSRSSADGDGEGGRQEEPATPEPAPPAQRAGAARRDGAPGERSPQPPEPDLILWVEELPGFVSPEYAERVRRSPFRFALRRDGSLLYRDADFQHFQVELTPEEVTALSEEIVATGFPHLGPLFEDPSQGVLVIDAGTESVGYHRDGRTRIVDLVGGARFMAQSHPDNDRVRVAVEVWKRLTGYRHPRALPR